MGAVSRLQSQGGVGIGGAESPEHLEIHASHAALFFFVVLVRSQSYLFTIHSCLRATAHPCIANREPSSGYPQGKNRYLSLYIDVIYVYMYRATAASPMGPLAETEGAQFFWQAPCF